MDFGPFLAPILDVLLTVLLDRFVPFWNSRSRGESAKDVEREMGIAGALNLIIEYATLGDVVD